MVNFILEQVFKLIIKKKVKYLHTLLTYRM